MASRSRLVITVTSTRGASTVNISSKGKYVSLPTNTISQWLPGQPLFTTASEQAYWEAVLPIVTAAIAAL